MGRRTAIGLDIGTSSVRAAELALRASGPELVHFGQIALPEGALRDGEVVDQNAVTEAIKELWKGGKFSHKKVTVGVANPRVVVRQVEVPFLAPNELRKALPLLVGDQVPIDASQAVLDFAPLEEIRTSDGARSLSGLLVAGVEEMIVRSVDAVIAAGLNPTVVDLNSFAVLRAVAASPGPGPDRAARGRRGHRRRPHQHRRARERHPPVRPHPADRRSGDDPGADGRARTVPDRGRAGQAGGGALRRHEQRRWPGRWVARPTT